MNDKVRKAENIDDFRRIPGVGKSIAQDFLNLGFSSVNELKGQNPEQLYKRLCSLKKCHVDRCMLYVFRCAIYFAETDHPDSELLKWWNWKDN